MSPRRQLQLAILLCLVGAALVLLGGSRPWVTVDDLSAPALGTVRHQVTGTTIAPGLRALGYVALAGVLVVAATRRWGRVAAGLLIAAVGAGTVAVAAGRLEDEPLVRAAAQVCARVGSACPAQSGQAVIFGAHSEPVALCVAGGLLVVASGVLTTARGRTWPGLGSSYQVSGPRPAEPVTDKGVWDALDRGDDPTA